MSSRPVPRPSRRPGAVVAVLAGLVFVVVSPFVLTASALADGPVGPAAALLPRPVAPAAATPDRAEAEAALRQVDSIFSAMHLSDVVGPEARGRRSADAAPGLTAAPTAPPASSGHARDATMALLRLGRSLGALPAAQRAAATTYYDRPSLPDVSCSISVCVHYTTTGSDAATTAFVGTVLSTFTHVHDTYVGAGYRAPLGDGTAGGDPRSDVYLLNIGTSGYYGYCSPDQPRAQQSAAYCVVDNDFSHAEFPHHTPVQNLEVTAAHEYFHAVQFGYDLQADRWFMEASATWAEDELYTGINDNRQYLPDSPLTRPRMSMDQFQGTFHYGTWIFFRYLTERFPTSSGGLPTLMLDLWRRCDASPGAPDEDSLQAITHVLRARDTSLTAQFAGFEAAALDPAHHFSEGRAYPSAPLARTVRIGTAHRLHQRAAYTLDHLTSATVRYAAQPSLRGRWRIRFALHLAPRARGSAVVVTTSTRGHLPRLHAIALSPRGTGSAAFDFSRGHTKWVEVTLVDAGAQYSCGHGTRFTCGGRSLDDGAHESIDASVVR